MPARFKVSIIFGTRPEAIKLAPVILAMRRDAEFECRVCVTAQHRELLDQVLEAFQIEPDVDLDLMQPNQTLGGLTSRAIEALDAYLANEKPQLVLVQGDTTTVFCATLAAFYQRIPVGHVEAGLRTGNLMAPWPEEANRVLTSRLAALKFAPTESSRKNLLKETVSSENVFVTGNTVIDALGSRPTRPASPLNSFAGQASQSFISQGNATARPASAGTCLRVACLCAARRQARKQAADRVRATPGHKKPLHATHLQFKIAA